MLRIRLLLLLKCFLVGVGRSQINLSSDRVSELPVHYPSPSQTHIFKESIPLIFTRDDIIGKDSVQLGHLHELIFVVRHKNVNQIAAILNDISNTSSQNYGHHLSKEQIDSLTSNQESRAAVVSCLLSIGASISSEIQSWEYITATAPVGSWELFFQSTFYKYYQLQHNGSKREFIRTHEYWIPKGMNDHIESVFNTIQLPHRLSGKQKEGCEELLYPSAKHHYTHISPEERASIESSYDEIRKFYDIGSTVGKKSSSQSVFAIDHLCEGFDNLESSYQSTKFIIKNEEDSRASKGSCNLLSYWDDTMMSSPGAPTSYHCTNACFSDWLMMMGKIAIPPLVVSLAMDMPEIFLSKSELDAFNTLAIKFGCMGVTIVAPSGGYRSSDRGEGTDDQVDYSLIPSFPASNPYVTAVAISMGDLTNDEEEDMNATQQSAHLSSPHKEQRVLSSYCPQHSWQASASAVLDGPSTPSQLPEHPDLAHLSSRAYPDITLRAYHDFKLSGTSLESCLSSCPSSYIAISIVAGLLSNINAAHIAAGKDSLGWINPLLYSSSVLLNEDDSSSDEGIEDGKGLITAGRRSRSSDLGSVTFQILRNMLLSSTESNSESQHITDIEDGKGHKSSDSNNDNRSNSKGKKGGDKHGSANSSSPSFSPTLSPVQILTRSPSPRQSEASGSPSRMNQQETMTPTSKPTSSSANYLDHAVAAVSQSFAGISLLDAKNVSFTNALMQTLSAEAKVPVTILSFTASTSTSTGTRQLLLSTSVSYVVYTTSNVTQSVIVPLLRSILTGSNFVTVLQKYSGFSNISVSDVVFTDLNPTSAPTSAPATKAAITATIIIAVGGAFVGVVLLAIFLCVIYCCCRRTDKHTDPESNSVEIVEEPPLASVVQLSSLGPDCQNSQSSTSDCPVAVLSNTTWESSYSTYALQDEICDYNPQLYP